MNNVMHVPVNVPITLHVTSDSPGFPPVNHGFWVPEVRLKADMVPGLINTLRFTPTVIGQYRIICTEFCGAFHGTMRAKLFIDSQKDFDAWFAKQGGAAAPAEKVALVAGDATAGQALFSQKCSACHSTGAFTAKIVGPGLGKIFADPDHPKLVNGTAPTDADAASIIKNGYQGDIGMMPDAKTNQLTDTDISNVVAYLETLSKK